MSNGPPERRKLPDTRQSITHKVVISDKAVGSMSLFLTVGLYPTEGDQLVLGRIEKHSAEPGEVFAHIGKQGTTLRGLMDTIAIELSLLLQYGVPLEEVVEQFKGTRFNPLGETSNPDIPECSSVIDYIVRWLEGEFIVKREEESDGDEDKD